MLRTGLTARTAPTGWRCLPQSQADLVTGETRFEAASGLHAKRQVHSEQLHSEQLAAISFTKTGATRRMRSF
jgi:hypothetical protein